MEIDRSKPLPTSLQSDFIPEDILLALTLPSPAPEQLGPVGKTRKQVGYRANIGYFPIIGVFSTEIWYDQRYGPIRDMLRSEIWYDQRYMVRSRVERSIKLWNMETRLIDQTFSS